MLPAELLELARAVCRQKAESQTLELKSARGGCPKRLYDTLSSFSNQDGGGVLLFGIDESEGWRVVGVYDDFFAAAEAEVRANSDQYIRSFSELLVP